MRTVVGIFAHPDDEAFGPGAGTLAKFAQEADVYVICVTNGDAKQDIPENEKQLGNIRKDELEKSCKILGIKKVFFLGYKDGSLCHNLYHEIAEKIQKYLAELQPDTLLTFEPRGVSGHIDHIVVSMISSFVFYRLPFIKSIYYACNSEELRNVVEDYFIHFPQGYKKSEVQKIIDTTDVWDIRIKAMQAHESQKEDMQKVLGWLKQIPKEEYFLVVEK